MYLELQRFRNLRSSRYNSNQWRTRRGGRPPSRVGKFRASSSCSKVLKDKKYFNTVKIFRTNSVFQGKRRLFKILNDKKYVFNAVNSGHTLFFSASTSCSKILNVKAIFNAVKNFRKNSVFRASASSSKIVISMQWKFSGQTLFFRASKSCSNILNVKSILNTAKNFMTNSVFGASASSSEILKNINIPMQ